MNSVGFAALGVPDALAADLAGRGIESPFPIQTATLPDTLAGRDVLGRGRTGSGKTLAFALPVVARLARLVPSGSALAARTRPSRPRALILAPTRELAGQILATVQPLADRAGLSVMTVFGGVGQAGQVAHLRRGTDIVVATPGRLEDLIGQGHASLDDVAITVLDEADHMADLGFLPAVTRLLAATPATGQRLLFSATLDHGVDKLVKRFLHDPLVRSVDSDASPVAEMTHHVLLVDSPANKRQVVRALAGGRSRRLLFTRTKHQARKLARDLTADGIPAVELHGNLSQNARERGLKAFAEGSVKVMVATDIAARGIHVDGVDLVVHVDPPAEHKAYLHRSGRTARAGHDGDVVTLVLPEQRRDFTAIARAAKITAQPAPVQPGDARLRDLVGGTAEPVAPDAAPAAAARKGTAGATGSSKRGASSARPGGNKGSGRSGGKASDGNRGAGQGRRGGASGGAGASSRGSNQASSRGSNGAASSAPPAPRAGRGYVTGSTTHGAASFSAQGSGGRRRNTRRAA